MWYPRCRCRRKVLRDSVRWQIAQCKGKVIIRRKRNKKTGAWTVISDENTTHGGIRCRQTTCSPLDWINTSHHHSRSCSPLPVPIVAQWFLLLVPGWNALQIMSYIHHFLYLIQMLVGDNSVKGNVEIVWDVKSNPQDYYYWTINMWNNYYL